MFYLASKYGADSRVSLTGSFISWNKKYLLLFFFILLIKLTI
jgi:hypothetical protein